MAKKFKMIVPKAGTANKDGTEVMLYPVDEIFDAKEEWQEDLMKTFIENGHAIEVKVDSADEEVVVDAELDEAPKRARNEKGQLVGDDPDTPDVNEAWEGGKAPKKKTTKKKTTKKKTTKKSS
tara:strand:+ start:2502 stop:2870 length:369 start_codon:yes stop_codon:yes gene_type:complete